MARVAAMTAFALVASCSGEPTPEAKARAEARRARESGHHVGGHGPAHARAVIEAGCTGAIVATLVRVRVTTGAAFRPYIDPVLRRLWAASCLMTENDRGMQGRIAADYERLVERVPSRVDLLQCGYAELVDGRTLIFDGADWK